ncbi:unnamed protein product [Nesidiocoris tenuis]|uniref:MICOS complex subunit MIC60 n=1 Tax=Nesidiocoris tenuis TaxID=355587 RepID=A0A6H5H0Z7_9HEMI|nr:unnamed protein product [Nesidiocoris tenuis]
MSKPVAEYRKYPRVSQAYTAQVNAMVEDSVEKQDPKIWPELRKKSQAKDQSVQRASEVASAAEANLKQLSRDLMDSNIQGSDDEKKQSRIKLKESLKKLVDARDEFNREKNLANVTNMFWSLVQQAREHFQDELGTLFPNFSITDKQMKLAEAEMDLFILYAFQTILYYQKELTKLEVSIGRIDSALTIFIINVL